MMRAGLDTDILIAGGGLAGGLIALALAAGRPDLSITIVEGGPTIGGNHIWSFFDSDIAAADHWLVEPLVSHAWQGYDVAFPDHARTLAAHYHSIRSERLDQAVRAALPAEAILTGTAIESLGPGEACLGDGRTIRAGGVIDARGTRNLAALDLGWQKFLGQELRLSGPHGLTRPTVMDATVAQIDGYRFVYLLPFAPDRLFIEDTYYSDTPEVDRDALSDRIRAYANARGWQIVEVLREEAGALPVLLGGDFEPLWGGDGVAKAGVRAGLFHPTTSYSLPDAVRTAALVARLPDLSGPAMHDALHAFAGQAWADRGFYRLLDRMLFRAAAPAERWRVLARFYRLSPRLIGRFYAGSSTIADKARLLAGKPPVPLVAAIRALRP